MEGSGEHRCVCAPPPSKDNICIIQELKNLGGKGSEMKDDHILNSAL